MLITNAYLMIFLPLRANFTHTAQILELYKMPIAFSGRTYRSLFLHYYYLVLFLSESK
jgi:hypothetical protein